KVSPNGKSKWELAQSALTAFVTDAKSAGMGVGLQYFPLVIPCGTDADCGASLFAGCSEQKVCVGAAGAMPPYTSCSNRACPTGMTCVPLGRCSQSGETCTGLNDICAGGSSSNRCTAIPKTCRDSPVAMCHVADYQKLAVPIGDLPGAAPALTLSLVMTQ